MKKILIYFLLIFSALSNLQSFSQHNEANIWYFGEFAGLDFNTGEPVVIQGYTHNFYGSASVCDTAGNLIIYSGGQKIWNRNYQIMLNGDNLIGDDYLVTQRVLIVPQPDSETIYYVFFVGRGPNSSSGQYGLWYNIVDMSGDNGLGEVIEKNKFLYAAWDATEKLFAVKHKNNKNIWIITRKFKEDKYAAFLITSSGLNTTPVLSNSTHISHINDQPGYLKISYDKKYIIAAYREYPEKMVEVGRFDANTGQIDILFREDKSDPYFGQLMHPFGIEFSPDSKFAYISYAYWGNDTIMGDFIYQYDMQYIEDSVLFAQSAVLVNDGGLKPGTGLQLARDGKIYCSFPHNGNFNYHYVSVIHHPEKRGTACNFEKDAIDMDYARVFYSFPNILLDYLYRFEWEGNCSGPYNGISFKPNFIPNPASILWNFNDPDAGADSISTELWPVHYFTHGGEFEVSVVVHYPPTPNYPFGRIEETSRIVEVEYAPEPDLGPDTTICSGQEVVLDAECGPHSYSWSTGQFGVSQIIVSDSGWYWVRVQSEAGCIAFDSIYIGYYPPAIVDTQNLEIIPTTCGGSMGIIRGLEVSGNPPFFYQWVNDLGNPIANTIDIFHLPVGNYTLQVIDGNDCLTEFGPYTIVDAGDVLIEDVNFTQEHCGQQNGSIIITATSGLSTMLFYSIDNGANYFTNQGIFTGLSSGTYAVRVKDSTDCQDVYLNNPIILENIPGPQVSDVQITPASIGQNDGAINIIASGNSDTLFYSNDNGANFQINDGLFTNLFPGYYTCIVMDEYNCDTTFIVEVTEEITIHLEAIAGDDEVCPGNAAYVPLIVNQFNDVATFRATLLFNKNLLECQGFANAHPQLEDSLDALLFPAEGRIELNWSSPSVTLPDGSILADLVFSSLNPGISQVEWDGEPGASFFHNPEGLQIPVDYYVGNVKIYNEVTLYLSSVVEACQGENVLLSPIVLSSNGDVTFLWTDPDGDTSSIEIKVINNIQPNQSGTYSLTVTDTLDCKADASIDVIVYPTPIPDFAGQDTIFTEVPVDLDAGAGFLYYLWNTGDSTQIITVQKNGWYAVEIESQQGCMGGDSVFVLFSTPPEPIPDIRIYLPNAFSPNGDGLNDEFKAVTNSENIESFQTLIYDRWGTLIFESNNISFGWNGTFKGKLCPQGVYVYKVEYSLSASPTGQSEIRIGTVVLVR